MRRILIELLGRGEFFYGRKYCNRKTMMTYVSNNREIHEHKMAYIGLKY